METIASISTPLGNGAISIVRMCGDNSLKIAKRLFSCKDFATEPRKLYLGNLKTSCGQEKCMAVYFKAPFSYTGEDMVEFQIHGGMFITQKVLETILANGARLAKPGEFSKIAFENQKISLDEAESIAEEINAQSSAELMASLNMASGVFKQKVVDMQNTLTNLLAEIEVNMDYPEESIEEATKNKIYTNLTDINLQIKKLIKDAESAKFFQNGVNCAIIGAANVGKSSLINALTGTEIAIVTEIAGTTRDVVRANFEYNGIKFNIIDTAGLRKTNNKVEKIGIDKAKQIAESADVVLLIFDAQSKEIEEEYKQYINKKNMICVVNKTDLKRNLPKIKNEISISAKEEKNIQILKQKMFEMVIKDGIDFNKVLMLNQRHTEILNNATDILSTLFKEKDSGLEIISMYIKKLWNTLGKITGQTETENIIDVIFSRFCLGK